MHTEYKLPADLPAEQHEYLKWLITEFEYKATWCEQNHLNADAAQHRAYIKQEIRRITRR